MPSGSRLVFDEQGWDLVSDTLREAFDFADEVAEASEARLKRANHEGEVRSGMVLLLFESMPQVPEADEARGDGPSTADEHAQQPARASTWRSLSRRAL